MVDVAGLVIRHPDALGEAREKVGGAGFAAAALEAGAGIASTLFGPELPAANPDRVPAAYIDAAVDRFAERTSAIPPSLQRSIQLALMSRGEKFNYRMRRTFIPGDGDFRAWSLPASSRALYWITRPIRAISKSA